MRLLIYSDVHWCTYSSIVRDRGEVFSKRLENLIESVSWAEATAMEEQCDRIYCLGDFFDQATLTAEELTALNQVNWAGSLPHYFITGNHEAGDKSLYLNSMEALNLLPFMRIIKTPSLEDVDDCEFIYLPYSQDYNLDWVDIDRLKYRVLFSHIDIKGIQMGVVLSKTGYDLGELDNLCNIGFNGHIHNGAKISSKLYNIGNLTGQNFSEDGFKYEHGVFVFDTETKELKFIQNPFALNFYKLDLRGNADYLTAAPLKNSVLSIQAFHPDKGKIKSLLPKINPVAYRVIYEYQQVVANNTTSDSAQLVATDYVTQFADYMLSLNSSQAVKDELAEVLK